MLQNMIYMVMNMTEMNTVKDLETNEIDFLCGVGIPSDELKQLVIEWIKQDIYDYRHSIFLLPEGQQGIDIHNFIVRERGKWKYRFNITEEDLE